MTDFSREVDATVAGALNPGEQVLWTGHCLSRLGKQNKAAPATKKAWLFVIPFTGIGLISLIGQLRSGPNLGMIVSAIFIGLGMSMAYGLVSAFWADSSMYCRKQTVYAITNQRAFVLRNCRMESPVQSLLWTYADEVRAERVGPDGRGSVQFLRWDRVEQRWVCALRFFMVGNARSVAERAIAARNAAQG